MSYSVHDARDVVKNLRACLSALSLKTPTSASYEGSGTSSSVCTIGLMLNGCVIDNMMPGSSSFLIGKIRPGDVIESVDGKEAKPENVVELIRGSDVPGSKVELKLRSSDRSFKELHVPREVRANVLQQRNLFMTLDEMRGLASSQILEQRGKKKPDDSLIKALNRFVDSSTAAIDNLTTVGNTQLLKEMELRDHIDKVKAVTRQYLDRLDSALANLVFSETVEGGGEGGGGEGGEGDGPKMNGSTSDKKFESLLHRCNELEARLSDRDAALQLQQQTHATAMLRLQAEIQSLQDQLAFAQAQGKEVTPAQPDDVTLSGQLSRAKTKMAKLEAELSVAKSTMQSKNAAIAEARMEAQAAHDASRADKESLRVCKENLERANGELKNLQRNLNLLSQKQGATESIASTADVSSLKVEIARLTQEVVAQTAKAAQAEKAAEQAKEEARILLRKRQADQSAIAQVEADVMAATRALAMQEHGDGANPTSEEGSKEEANAGDQHVEEDPSQNPNPERHKYEAAIIKIGSLQQKVAELQGVIKSYQKDGKTGILEMQTAARTATEAKQELESEKKRRNEERTQLTAKMQTQRDELENKVLMTEKARVKLQELLAKKEAQLERVTEEARKAATTMKEEMQNMQARHEQAWQRTADAVDRLEKETTEAKGERDAAVKAKKEQESYVKSMEEEVKQMKERLEQETRRASEAVEAASKEARQVIDQKEQECKDRILQLETDSALKLKAMQEQLRAAHDSVTDSYAMVAQAQARCLEEVERAREREGAAKKEAKEAQEAQQQELKKLQRHLAGVSGAKEAEVERMSTRIATLEMTIRTRNAESVALQLEIERLKQQSEQERQRREAMEEDYQHAMKRLAKSDEAIARAEARAREAAERGQEREREFIRSMQDEFKEDGLLEVRLDETSREVERLKKVNAELRERLEEAPGTKLEAEAAALRAQVEAQEKDLEQTRTQLRELREAEQKRSERMLSALGQGSESGLAKDLNELLSMKLEKSTFDAALREAREDAAAAHQAIEDANVIHEQQLAMVHAAAAKREGELEGEKEELQKEVERLMKSLEDKSSELAAAEERANKAENQLALLRSKVASMEGELKREQQRRRDEIDEINRSKELAIEELEARQRELTDSVEEWKGIAERGDYGTVKQLREDLDQLRETAEEEVANLTIRLQDLESARRKEVGKLQASLTAKQNEMSSTTSKLKQQLDNLEQRAKEKENANRQLQRQVATYEAALSEANSEIEILRDQVSHLQKEVGEAEVDMLKKDRELRSLHGDAAAAQKEVLEELAKEVGGTPPVQAGITTGSTKKSKGGGWLGLKGK